MSGVPKWEGHKAQAARQIVAGWLPSACGQCGQVVTTEDAWVVGHIRPRSMRPDLTWVVSNWQVEHRACSDRTGQSVVIEKAKSEALREHGIEVGDDHDFPARRAPGQPRSFLSLPSEAPLSLAQTCGGPIPHR